MRQATNRIRERDCVLEVQVRALADEAVVRLLADDDLDVLGHAGRHLVAVAAEGDLRAGLEARLDGHLEDLLRRPRQRRALARDLELLRAAAVEVLEAAAERDLDDGPLEPLALAPRAARAAEEVAHAAEAALARGPLPRKARAEELREHLGRVAAELVAHAAARRRPREARRRARAPRRRLGVGLVGRPGPALEALDAVDVVDLALLRVREDLVRLVELLRAVEGSVVEVVESVIYRGTVREIDGPSRCGRALGVIVPRNAHGVEAEQVERAEVPQDHVPIAAPCALHIDPLARQHGTGALHAWIEAPARRVQVIVGERWVAHARAGDARVGHVVLLMQPIVDLPGGRVADHQQRMRAEPLQHLSELGSHWR